MLHIYSIAVRADKNDMAIEPEGMDTKEKGKGGLVKEWGRGGNFANGTDFERQTQTSHTPPPTLLFTPFSPTSENPLYTLPPSSQPFPLLFCIIFTHRTKSLIFFPHTSFAWSHHTLPLWQIVILQPFSSHTPFFSPPPNSSLLQQQHPPDSTKFLWNSTSQMSFCLVGF